MKRPAAQRSCGAAALDQVLLSVNPSLYSLSSRWASTCPQGQIGAAARVFINGPLSSLCSSWHQLAGLGKLPSLCELTLDGNPVALETWYKQAVLRCVLHLRQLDMKRVTVRPPTPLLLSPCVHPPCIGTGPADRPHWLLTHLAIPVPECRSPKQSCRSHRLRRLHRSQIGPEAADWGLTGKTGASSPVGIHRAAALLTREPENCQSAERTGRAVAPKAPKTPQKRRLTPEWFWASTVHKSCAGPQNR